MYKHHKVKYITVSFFKKLVSGDKQILISSLTLVFILSSVVFFNVGNASQIHKAELSFTEKSQNSNVIGSVMPASCESGYEHTAGECACYGVTACGQCGNPACVSGACGPSNGSTFSAQPFSGFCDSGSFSGLTEYPTCGPSFGYPEACVSRGGSNIYDCSNIVFYSGNYFQDNDYNEVYCSDYIGSESYAPPECYSSSFLGTCTSNPSNTKWTWSCSGNNGVNSYCSSGNISAACSSATALKYKEIEFVNLQQKEEEGIQKTFCGLGKFIFKDNGDRRKSWFCQDENKAAENVSPVIDSTVANCDVQIVAPAVRVEVKKVNP